MRFFLTFAAILAALVGGMLLFARPTLYMPAGIAITPETQSLAHFFAGILLGLAILDWLARDSNGASLTAVLLANLLAQLLCAAVVASLMQTASDAGLAPALLIHTVLAALFLWFAVRAGASPRQTSS